MQPHKPYISPRRRQRKAGEGDGIAPSSKMFEHVAISAGVSSGIALVFLAGAIAIGQAACPADSSDESNTPSEEGSSGECDNECETPVFSE